MRHILPCCYCDTVALLFQVWDTRSTDGVKRTIGGPHICGDSLDIKVSNDTKYGSTRSRSNAIQSGKDDRLYGRKIK